jgi:hypothetical protein
LGLGAEWYLSNLKSKKFVSAGFGFSDKPQPKYGFDYTLDGKMIVTHTDYSVSPNNALSIT